MKKSGKLDFIAFFFERKSWHATCYYISVRERNEYKQRRAGHDFYCC